MSFGVDAAAVAAAATIAAAYDACATPVRRGRRHDLRARWTQVYMTIRWPAEIRSSQDSRTPPPWRQPAPASDKFRRANGPPYNIVIVTNIINCRPFETCAPPPLSPPSEHPQHRDTNSNDRPVPPLRVTMSFSSTRLLYKKSEYEHFVGRITALYISTVEFWTYR